MVFLSLQGDEVVAAELAVDVTLRVIGAFLGLVLHESIASGKADLGFARAADVRAIALLLGPFLVAVGVIRRHGGDP